MAGAFRNVVRDSRQKLEHSAEIKEEPILFSTARPFKAILAVMIVLVVCYGMFVPASYAFADETNGATAELTDEQKSASVIQLERVNANLPIVKVYLQLDNSAPFSAGDVIATLGDKPLLPESLSSLEDAGEGTTYFFLVDCSTSIFQADMDGVKQMLDAFVNNKGSLDRIVLIAFGERVDVLLDGGEDSQTAIERINILAPTQQATLFNDAVIKALDLAETEQANLPERKVIIVVSDGINYDEAAGSTEQEVLGRLDSASVPLYAICLPSADSGANPQAFGQLARKSGGDIRMAEGANISSEFLAMNSHISAIKVLTLQASNNIIESPEQQLAISISLGDRVIVNGGTRTVTVKSHIPDSEAPVILRAEQLDESRIKIYFSEPVFNAEKNGSYVIRDDDNQALTIQSVSYQENDESITAEITLEGKPYSGEYTLETVSITDKSMEKNTVENTITFEFEGQAVVLKYLQIIVFDYWWVILLVALIVILLIVFRVIRKRKGFVKVDGKIGFGDAVEFKHHFETPKSKYLRLLVIDADGMGTQVDLDVESSVFIGRAKSNNLSFDDTKMSRQHFVIETAENGFYITDLDSANGTFVNNERLAKKRLLKDGDTITAGHEKFIYQESSKSAPSA